ncbi:hypothetical protein CO657_22950 (plasmid) [Rhizobium acidisoli]|uniref:NADP-dependent oxidoreductase domain-containing protein n=4 Tax=Rhizobium acidisoli TaxID=1538158 RepID=A0AAE5TZN0_9HYPH|nr:aldo/keto reductase [Rhizobium acidisoli]QAS80889.1 hypothetical protein CO657_22950 [Rhizobium acidisoli]
MSGNDGMLGYGGATMRDAAVLLDLAGDLGIKLIDTATAYGDGLIERVLSETASLHRYDFNIVTKCGWDTGTGCFLDNASAIARQLDVSLTRFSAYSPPTVLLHSPPPELLSRAELLAPLVEYKRSGDIKALGVSVRFYEDAATLLDFDEIEVVQLPYNPVIAADGTDLIERLAAAGKRLMAREVLMNGLFTNRYPDGHRFPADDMRATWPLSLRSRVEAFRRDWRQFRRDGESTLSFAIRFAFDRSEFEMVIVGARTRVQVEALAAVVRSHSSLHPSPKLRKEERPMAEPTGSSPQFPRMGFSASPNMAMSPRGAFAVTPNMAMSPRGAFAVTPNMAMSPRGAFAVTPNMAMSPRGAFAVTPNMAMSPRGAFAVTPNMAMSPRGAFAVTPNMAMSPRGAFAVTPNMAMSPRGAFAVTPNMAMSPRGAFAVTPNMAMSPRGAFAVTPNMAMSPRGAFAVTPNMAMSPRGAFAVTPNSTFGDAAAIPHTGSVGPSPFYSLMTMAEMMPPFIIEAILRELDITMPQRKTDIYYEEDDVVHIRRSGLQYTLWPPASLFWSAMGKVKTTDIITDIAEKLGSPDRKELRLVIGDFLLSAALSDLVILYPEDISKENLSPQKPES